MRLRAKYTIKGREFKRVWVDHKSYVAAISWEDRTLYISRKRWERLSEATQEEVLAHEFAHGLWWHDHEDEDHPTWQLRHNDFARYAVTVNRIIRTGSDAL